MTRLFLAMLTIAFAAQTSGLHPLQQVYQNNDFQLTGISVSKMGRLFVNFPRWSDRYINDSRTFNGGKSSRKLPYEVFKFKP